MLNLKTRTVMRLMCATLFASLVASCATEEFVETKGQCEATWLSKMPPKYKEKMYDSMRSRQVPTGTTNCYQTMSGVTCNQVMRTEFYTVPAVRTIDIFKDGRDARIAACTQQKCIERYGNAECNASNKIATSRSPTTSEKEQKADEVLGDFRLGHNVIVAPKITRGEGSIVVPKQVFVGAVEKSNVEQFKVYSGSSLYHLGISLEGYTVSPPETLGFRSALIAAVTVWNDTTSSKLNQNPKVFTVTYDPMSTDVNTATQVTNLSKKLSTEIEKWLVIQNTESDWFNQK